MRPRYLAVASSSLTQAESAQRRHILAFGRRHGLSVVFESKGLLVVAGKGDVVPWPDGQGLVLGTLFPRTPGAPRVRDAQVLTGLAFRADRATQLVHDYWGAYVVMLTGGPGTLEIVRAPFGELPCYYAQNEDGLAFSSDIELLGAGMVPAPKIDWQAVGRFLVASELRQPATCLEGVSEVLGGSRLTLADGRAEVSVVWSPWDHVELDAGSDTMACAAARVRATASDCVGRWGGCFDLVLLGVSGGLDSSIVAACLDEHHQRYSCLTLFTEDPIGDERGYARLLAAALGRPLVERFRTLAGVDLARSNAAHLPRPVGRSFAQESERLSLEAARASGADAIFRGGGGDNVFCYLQSVSPIADRLLTVGPGRAALATALDMCRITDCTLWTASWRAARRAWFRRPNYPWSCDMNFLSTDLVGLATDSFDHLWLDAPAGTLPGKAAHIALLLAMQNHMEGLAPAHDLPLLSPLMSQPLVECCLRIPSWLWCEGGNNRMVARTAFAADLPPAIIARRSKGTPDAFVADLFEARREQILLLLGDGLLAAHGLLDLRALLPAIADTRPISSHDFSRIMQLVDVEAWARARSAV